MVSAFRSVVLAGLLVTAAWPLAAQSLGETLVSAYRSSPVLEAQRAALRAVDEGVAQALAGRRPRVEASGEASLSDSSDSDLSDRYSAGVDASLTLYDHGRTEAAVDSARAGVEAGRADLMSAEQDVLLDAVTAHIDIRRDARLVMLSESNVSVLQEQVQAARDRFEVGDVTRTDVSLAEARLAAARSELAAAEGQLRLSQDRYAAVVGVPARAVLEPPPLPRLAASLEAAEAIALREHPAIVAARFREQAATYDLDRARRGFGPTATLGGSVSLTRAPTQFSGDETSINAGVSLQGSVPIYSGGTLESAVRQSEALLGQRKAQLQAAARQVRQQVAAGWSNLAVARASIVASQQQIAAAEIAVQGVREEQLLGARTTLDVLDREQELRDAQFQLVSAQRDEVAAAYGLLAAMGLMTADYLNLPVERYDPALNYSRVEPAGVPQRAGADAAAAEVPGRANTGFDGSAVDRIKDRWGFY